MPFHIRINEVVNVGTAILSEPKFLARIDNQIFLPMVLRCASFARERATTISYNKNWLLFPLALGGIFHSAWENLIQFWAIQQRVLGSAIDHYALDVFVSEIN